METSRNEMKATIYTTFPANPYSHINVYALTGIQLPVPSHNYLSAPVQILPLLLGRPHVIVINGNTYVVLTVCQALL